MLTKLLNLYVLKIVSTTIFNATKANHRPLPPLTYNFSREQISFIFEFIKYSAPSKLIHTSFNIFLHILSLTRFILYKYVLPTRMIWELCRFQNVYRLNICFTRLLPNVMLALQRILLMFIISLIIKIIIGFKMLFLFINKTIFQRV